MQVAQSTVRPSVKTVQSCVHCVGSCPVQGPDVLDGRQPASHLAA